MRITGGEYRGRILTVPKGDAVRPATDKVRQAVFNSLQNRIDLSDCHVIDGFCGSGSYGIEALSRGAGSCLFIDKDRKSLDATRQNIQPLGIKDQCQILQKDMKGLPQRADTFHAADLLFLDPPYHQDLLLPALEHLQENGWLSKGCVCVLECEAELDIPFGDQKTYGAIKIIYSTF